MLRKLFGKWRRPNLDKIGAKVGAFAFTYRIQLLRKPFGVQDLRSAVDDAVPA